jgi:hypothetical protein
VGPRGAPTLTRSTSFCVIWVCISSSLGWSPQNASYKRRVCEHVL